MNLRLRTFLSWQTPCRAGSLTGSIRSVQYILHDQNIQGVPKKVHNKITQRIATGSVNIQLLSIIATGRGIHYSYRQSYYRIIVHFPSLVNLRPHNCTLTLRGVILCVILLKTFLGHPVFKLELILIIFISFRQNLNPAEHVWGWKGAG